MNKVAIIARHEFVYTLRRKTFLFMTFLFPALMVGIVALVAVVSVRGFQGSADLETVGLVDTANLTLNHPPTDFQVIRYSSEATAKEALLDENIQEYYVIPPNYLATGSILRYSTRRSLAAAEAAENKFLRELTLLNLIPSDVSSDVASRLRDPVNMVSIRLGRAGEAEEPVNEVSEFLVPYFFAFLLMMAIFVSSGYLLQGVGEDKENRIIEILVSSVTPRQLLMGKVAGLGFAGLFQIVIWLVAGRVALGIGTVNLEFLQEITFPLGTVALSLVYFFMGYLFFAVVMAGFGAVASTSREGQQISGVFTFIAVIPFILAQVIIENPDSTLAMALTLIPFTSPVAAMIRFASAEPPLWQVAASLGILGISTLVALWATAKIFRVYLLMYGRRPGLREILGSLRAA